MHKTLSTIAMFGAAIWLQWAATAMGQNASPYYGLVASPAVSPYLNLGVTPGGLSNYQSLVKPMIEDREALSRQAINIQRLQQQLRDSREKPTGEPAAQDGKSRPGAVRFMHYSHYFGKLP